MPLSRPSVHLDKTTRLQSGDTVMVAVGVFGKDYAVSRGASPWTSEEVRDEGQVIGRENNKWKVKFADGEHLFDRKALAFEGRAAPAASSSSQIHFNINYIYTYNVLV